MNIQIISVEDQARIERFSSVAWSALCEIGRQDLAEAAPTFFNYADGMPYLEFDTDDAPEDSLEFQMMIRAEELAREAIAKMPRGLSVDLTAYVASVRFIKGTA